jgi:hypothetical protein
MAITGTHFYSNQRRQFQSLVNNVIEFEFIWDPASVNSNSFVAESITVSGVKLGDMVLVTYEGDQQDLIITGHVSAEDTVNIHLFNPTAGAVDLASAHGHCVILQFNHHHHH